MPKPCAEVKLGKVNTFFKDEKVLIKPKDGGPLIYRERKKNKIIDGKAISFR